MEMSFTTTVFFLFLLLTPSFCCCSSSEGGSENGGLGSSQVYEIDYRGPETHSSHISPPHPSHGRPWIVHHHHPLHPPPYPLKGSKVGA
ncbi:uncharacterized protein LOC111478885 [Cucurbita maxima]|uniref:Uncharacterized protein LOC111478885 n=1 Tax=Cucurbita maxima TaxID=3661 RepID=A0A6J1IQ06_CUCMA|nr:uncharacterized protein LOC111478885 [Cucurbita maxima]